MDSPLRVHPSQSALDRSYTHDIRQEREELRDAAEQTINTIVDLNLDCTIKWASPSWADVVGTLPDSVIGKSMSDLIVSDNKTVLADVIESMTNDNGRSHRVRFAVALGTLSKLLPLAGIAADGGVKSADKDDDNDKDQQPPTSQDSTTAGAPSQTPVSSNLPVMDIEAQGIMVYDHSSGRESHVSIG